MRTGIIASVSLIATLALASRAVGATHMGFGIRSSYAQMYNPTDYLSRKASGGLRQPDSEVSFQAPSLARLAGVTCSAESANAQPAPPVAKGCAANDPNCLSQWMHSANSSHTEVPSGAEIAEQLVGLLKDNCRAASGDKAGFGPTIEVNVGQTNDVVRKRQVSATVGINGSF